jgi:hypothetical protein
VFPLFCPNPVHNRINGSSVRTSSIVRVLNNSKIKHDVSDTSSVSFLRWRETPTLLSPLERANPNHWKLVIEISAFKWTQQSISQPSSEDGNRSVSETLSYRPLLTFPLCSSSLLFFTSRFLLLLARGVGCVGLPYRWAPLYLHLHVYPDARYE